MQIEKNLIPLISDKISENLNNQPKKETEPTIPVSTKNDSLELSLGQAKGVEKILEFVETEPKNKFARQVEETVDKLRNSKTPEEKGKILESFQRSLNAKTTGPSLGMLGDGLAVYSIKTEYNNSSLRPFFKYTREQIAESKENNQPEELKLYQEILKALKSARKERFSDDSSPPNRTSLVKLY